MAKPPTVRMMKNSISGQASIPSKPPRQQRGIDPKNSTFGAPSSSELITSGQVQSKYLFLLITDRVIRPLIT